MRIRLLSDANVASMWESKGDAARRRRGCVGVIALDFEGDEPAGEAAAMDRQLWFRLDRGRETYTCHSFPQALK